MHDEQVALMERMTAADPSKSRVGFLPSFPAIVPLHGRNREAWPYRCLLDVLMESWSEY